jgi:hypothetical protein
VRAPYRDFEGWVRWNREHDEQSERSDWPPARGIKPPPKHEVWRWHWKDGAWWGKSYKEGSREGGPDTVPGKHTEHNRRKKERRLERQERIRAEDADDPEGAGAREAARRAEAAENELLHQLRTRTMNVVIEASAKAVAGKTFAAAAEAEQRRWTNEARQWADQEREAGASRGSGDSWQERRQSKGGARASSGSRDIWHEDGGWHESGGKGGKSGSGGKGGKGGKHWSPTSGWTTGGQGSWESWGDRESWDDRGPRPGW